MAAPDGSAPGGRAQAVPAAPGLALGQAPSRQATLPWTVRLVELVSAYLPLLLMGLLALGTWWLVKNSPSFETEGADKPLRHEPDYTMARFSVERFTREGRLRVRIEGDEMRHYPDTDTVEVDNPRIRSFAPDGRATIATARRAISNGDGSEVQLLGGAQVVREAAANEAATEFRGEFLHAFFNTEELRSHLPVTLRRGNTELRADTLDYHHRDRRVQLKGRVRATFPPAGEAVLPRTGP
ncbi:MAG: LPS export ABC transporter periplasmic protein LptC [Ideonella sp.]|nr:LPS export ABC transporter periplasmic protein LptC [Ideonella sp.]